MKGGETKDPGLTHKNDKKDQLRRRHTHTEAQRDFIFTTQKDEIHRHEASQQNLY